MKFVFLTFLVLFFIATLRLRSAPELKTLGYDPVRLMRIVLIVSAIIWLMPITEVPDFISVKWTAMYFLSTLLSLAALAWGTRIETKLSNGLVKSEDAITSLMFLSVPFALYYLAGGGFVSDLTNAIRESQSDLRIQMWAGFGDEGDALQIILGFFAYPAAHIWTIKKPNTLTFWWSLLLLGFFAVSNSAIGGRMPLVFSSFVCLLLLHTKYDLRPSRMLKERTFRFVLLGVALMSFGYYVLYYVLAERIPQMAAQYDHISYMVVGAHPTPFMNHLNDITNGAAGSLAISFGYFSAPITFYQNFMSHPCCLGQNGVYNFPFLDRLYGESWFDIRAQIAYYWARQGLSPNPWSTAYRDWYIDFGLIGSMVFNFIVFGFLGTILRSAARDGSNYANLLAAYATGFLLVMPFLSPLLIQTISIPFYALCVVYLFVSNSKVKVAGIPANGQAIHA